ncbi:exported hypothetical protein [Xanthomonas phaseoli pv. phaseoli]|uniref:Secreted protein n=1 Tax=Xanthomonas campestris pv. phaseoli TaxID=317013 RepID=A0AB38DV71_XANCH|nr:exported hypothetical protein [Xanthomonas phaseoli pv. phaseoli]SON75956.1 exported hypothetical protein [Xanthomonas phaseoli pv. phaseoli]SON77665.1 exported hypothetical protein [Xanthomonas phaseoli pv. phaseoli]SOO30524.1 exported hypothetical protein [Xanthomonas phaseoli pv. phaseoli]
MQGRALLLGVWLVLACHQPAHAQARQQTDTTTRVMLRQQLAASCVSLAGAQATILLDRAELERLASATPAAGAAAADEDARRQALLAATRAQALLAATGNARDRFGCAVAHDDKESADTLSGWSLAGARPSRNLDPIATGFRAGPGDQTGRPALPERADGQCVLSCCQRRRACHGAGRVRSLIPHRAARTHTQASQQDATRAILSLLSDLNAGVP